MPSATSSRCVFVATLVVPVLRYDLWAIDSIIRRLGGLRPSTRPRDRGRAPVRADRGDAAAPRTSPCVAATGCSPSYGAPTDDVEAWPLVARRRPRRRARGGAPTRHRAAFTEPDRRILATVAQLVGGSVRAEALTADLLDARHRLVTAREEERRRLRRDLHDGLGPLLTGLGLNLDAAAAQLGRSQDKTATLPRQRQGRRRRRSSPASASSSTGSVRRRSTSSDSPAR